MPGAVIELSSGAARARLVPHAGGRVSSLRFARPGSDVAVDVLYPYPEDFFDPLRWAKGGIYPLIPYSGRIANARLRVGERSIELPPHPDSAPHTLHGNAQGLPWQVVAHEAARAELSLASAVCAPWPWSYEARMVIALASASRLDMSVSVRNTGDSVMPAGIGVHPFFLHAPGASLRLHAETVWPALSVSPAEAVRARRAEESWTQPRALPPGPVNLSFGAWDGRAELMLPEGARLRIEADPVFAHLVLHRPDPPRYVCVEPVSHVSDGFNLEVLGVAGTGTRWLAPGESMQGSVCFSLA